MCPLISKQRRLYALGYCHPCESFSHRGSAKESFDVVLAGESLIEDCSAPPRNLILRRIAGRRYVGYQFRFQRTDRPPLSYGLISTLSHSPRTSVQGRLVARSRLGFPQQSDPACGAWLYEY